MITPNYILSREYNPKQVELYNGVVLACSGQSKARTFVLGGAIRGGKTFGVLIVLDRLCVSTQIAGGQLYAPICLVFCERLYRALKR